MSDFLFLFYLGLYIVGAIASLFIQDGLTSLVGALSLLWFQGAVEDSVYES